MLKNEKTIGRYDKIVYLCAADAKPLSEVLCLLTSCYKEKKEALCSFLQAENLGNFQVAIKLK